MPQSATHHKCIALTDVTAGGNAPTVPVGFSTFPVLMAGTGTPTCAAPKGSLYINTTASAISTRLYVNTDGGTTWTAFTTAA